ncbi:hypothetical protein KJ591_01795 [Patescibacteria group bacterium]|nr:hypothetical protein [Patescibacteria group bacterium]
MQVFDYHLNPKLRKDINFKSFYFKPEVKDEEKLGSLCIVGELTNFLSKDKKLLDQVAEKIKQAFYSNTDRNPESALNRALHNANQYLNSIIEKDGQTWLGNLHLAVININDHTINFSKSGDIRLLLLRHSEYTDIAENLEFQASHPESKKYFTNIATGQIAPEDKIIIITQNLNEFFETYLSNHLLGLKNFNHKNLNKLIKEKKEEMKDFSGVLLVLAINVQQFKGRLLKYFFPKIKIKIKFRKEIVLVIAFFLILFFSYLIFR